MCRVSWCTKDVAVGSGCGDNSNHLCSAPPALSVTVTITSVTTERGAGGRRLSEESGSWSVDTAEEGVHVEYEVVSTTELDTAAAAFDGAALSGALRDAGGTLGPFDPDEIAPLNATFTTVIQYSIAVEADTWADAGNVGEAASMAMDEISLCLAGPGSCLSVATSSAVQQARCGEGHELDLSMSECLPCREGTAGVAECIVCGVGKEPDRRRARCIPCTGNFSASAGKCELCPAGTVVSSDRGSCVVQLSAETPQAVVEQANIRGSNSVAVQVATPSCAVATPEILLGVHVAAAVLITLCWLVTATRATTDGAFRSIGKRRGVLFRGAICFSVSSIAGAVIDLLLTCGSSCTGAQLVAPTVGAFLCSLPIPYVLHRTLRTGASVGQPHRQEAADAAARRPATPPKLGGHGSAPAAARPLPAPMVPELSPNGVPRPPPRPHGRTEDAPEPAGAEPALSLGSRLRGGEQKEAKRRDQARGYDLRALTVVAPPDEDLDSLDAPDMPRFLPEDDVELRPPGADALRIGLSAPVPPRRPARRQGGGPQRSVTESGDEQGVSSRDEGPRLGEERILPRPPKRPPIQQQQQAQGKGRSTRMFVAAARPTVDQLHAGFPPAAAQLHKSSRVGARSAISSSSSGSSSDSDSDDDMRSDGDDDVRQAERCEMPPRLDHADHAGTVMPAASATNVASSHVSAMALPAVEKREVAASPSTAAILWFCIGFGCWRWSKQMMTNGCWRWGTVLCWGTVQMGVVLISYLVKPGGTKVHACHAGTGRRYTDSHRGPPTAQPASPSTPRAAFQ